MGRAIMGDIDGKCWFAVQPSNFADRFGREGSCSHLDYFFEDSDLPLIESELKRIEDKLGDKIPSLDEYFKTHMGYTDDEIQELFECNEEEAKFILREYADYEFGIELRDYLKKNAYCQFSVEL